MNSAFTKRDHDGDTGTIYLAKILGREERGTLIIVKGTNPAGHTGSDPRESRGLSKDSSTSARSGLDFRNRLLPSSRSAGRP